MGSDFRLLFASLDDEAVITTAEYAKLISTTPESVHTRNHRKELPPVSAISRRRGLLWRVGDVRAWIRGESTTAALIAGREGKADDTGKYAKAVGLNRNTAKAAVPLRTGRPRRVDHIPSAAPRGMRVPPEKQRQPGLGAVDAGRKA